MTLYRALYHGIPVIGTAERLTGVALISSFTKDEKGRISYEYEGTTEIDWDAQATEKDLNGTEMVVTETGQVVSLADCDLVPIPETENP